MSFIELLSADPALFAFCAGIIGLMVGSFLNVVIYRLPLMLEREWRSQCAELYARPELQASTPGLSLMWPPSQCPHCAHRIGALENIPLLSYLWQRGRCTACGGPISLRYPLVELCSGLLTAFVAWHFGFGWAASGAILLTWALLALSLIDFDHQLLPDNITLPFLWLGLLFNLLGQYVPLKEAVLGAMAGYVSLWLVFQIFKLLTGKDGMGYGDFKLLAMFGAWLGWKMLPLIVLLSSLVGAAVGIFLIVLHKQDRNQAIPFGPYLACAGWVALLWGPELTRAYILWTSGGTGF